MKTMKATNTLKYMSLLTALLCLLTLATTACGSDDDDKDMTPPAITGEGITASPINCDVYHPGDVIAFRYLFTDDVELGSYNIEVHSNFDHHSHSTEADDHGHEAGECDGDEHEHEHEHEGEEAEGTAWVYNQSFSIPAGQTRFLASVDIAIPADARHGDYHFMVRLTDRAGWQQLKALAIKIDE